MPSSDHKVVESAVPSLQCIAFDRFEMDPRSGELRQSGHRIRLQAQPFQLLTLLIEHAGDVVTRDEVCRKLWPADTFVDFDHGVAAAVNKIREALGDSADDPRFVETIPKRGYRFIGVVKRDLAPAPTVIRSPVDQEGAAGKPVGGLRTTVWILVSVACTLALLLGWLNWRPHAETVRLTPVPFTSYPGMEVAPAFSPDGSRIAFAWDGGDASKTGYDLYVKAIGSETLLRLTTHPSQWLSPVWSPDGTQIAIHRIAGTDTGIYLVPALGGPERKLRTTHVPYEVAAPISWSADGKWIAYSDPSPGEARDRMFLLSVETLETQQIPHNPRCLHEADLTFSHTGNEAVYLCVRNTNDFEIYSFTAPNGQPRLVTAFPDFVFGLAWSGDDKSLIIGQTSAAGGGLAEVAIRDGVLRKLSLMPNGRWPTLSRIGNRLAYSASTDHISIWQKDFMHPEAPAVQLVASTRQQNTGQYSPDGKHFVFDSTRAGSWNVWMSDADGSNLVQISPLNLAGNPSWSPDSQKIVFEASESGHSALYVADISERIARKLVTNVRELTRPSWSHDGKWIYFRAYESIGHKIYRCPATGGDATLMTSEPDGVEPQESFDGKTLYFASRNVNATLRMVSLDEGHSESAVVGMPTLFTHKLWAVALGGIYFVPAAAPKTVCYFDFATRQIRDLFKVEKDFDDGLSVSSDGRYVLFSLMDEKSSDIMLVEHFP